MGIHVMNLCMLATPFDLLCVTVTPLMLQVTDRFGRQVNMLLLGQGIKCEAEQCESARTGLRESDFELSCTAPMAVLEHSLGAVVSVWQVLWHRQQLVRRAQRATWTASRRVAGRRLPVAALAASAALFLRRLRVRRWHRSTEAAC